MNSGGLYGTPILGRLTRGALAAICRLSNSWEFGSEPQFYGRPIISSTSQSRIVLGDRCVLISLPRYTALGVPHPCVLRTLTPSAEIAIGDDVGMSGASVCAAVSVSIGHRVMLGSGVIVADTDFHPVGVPGRRYVPSSDASSAAVKIEDDVFLGVNSIVLKGVTIGCGSVIGAGSVVSGDIPPGVVAAGNPCRPLRGIVTAVNRFLPSPVKSRGFQMAPVVIVTGTLAALCLLVAFGRLPELAVLSALMVFTWVGYVAPGVMTALLLAVGVAPLALVMIPGFPGDAALVVGGLRPLDGVLAGMCGAVVIRVLLPGVSGSRFALSLRLVVGALSTWIMLEAVRNFDLYGLSAFGEMRTRYLLLIIPVYMAAFGREAGYRRRTELMTVGATLVFAVLCLPLIGGFKGWGIGPLSRYLVCCKLLRDGARSHMARTQPQVQGRRTLRSRLVGLCARRLRIDLRRRSSVGLASVCCRLAHARHDW